MGYIYAYRYTFAILQCSGDMLLLKCALEQVCFLTFDITLFISITMLCMTNNIKQNILFRLNMRNIPHNIVNPAQQCYGSEHYYESLPRHILLIYTNFLNPCYLYISLYISCCIKLEGGSVIGLRVGSRRFLCNP